MMGTRHRNQTQHFADVPRHIFHAEPELAVPLCHAFTDQPEQNHRDRNQNQVKDDEQRRTDRGYRNRHAHRRRDLRQIVHQHTGQHFHIFHISQHFRLQNAHFVGIMVVHGKMLETRTERGAQIALHLTAHTAERPRIDNVCRNVLQNDDRPENKQFEDLRNAARWSAGNQVDDIRRNDRNNVHRAGFDQIHEHHKHQFPLVSGIKPAIGLDRMPIPVFSPEHFIHNVRLSLYFVERV